jgi:hypothetical protein
MDVLAECTPKFIDQSYYSVFFSSCGAHGGLLIRDAG